MDLYKSERKFEYFNTAHNFITTLWSFEPSALILRSPWFSYFYLLWSWEVFQFLIFTFTASQCLKIHLFLAPKNGCVQPEVHFNGSFIDAIKLRTPKMKNDHRRRKIYFELHDEPNIFNGCWMTLIITHSNLFGLWIFSSRMFAYMVKIIYNIGRTL